MKTTTCCILLLSLLTGLDLLASAQEPAPNPQETHLRNLRQLTFGGTNAEAYFSSDGKQLIFQATPPGGKCDQIYTMNVDGSGVRQLSQGGRTTCAYFFPGGKRVLYASTYRTSMECPPAPDWSHGYRWAIYPSYEIYSANPDGSGIKQLTHHWGYDAEAVVSPDGKKIVFTSLRHGDLDIYTMDADGGHVKRLTRELGYDGGPFFSPDGQWIVYRAYHPTTPADIAEYRRLLKQDLYHPTTLDLWVMRADGSDKRQITHFNAASFAPFFFPDGRRIIFASNMHSGQGMGNFELYAVNLDGSGLERLTYAEGFDGFPMFSPDGSKLVFASQRNSKSREAIDIYIADWVP